MVLGLFRAWSGRVSRSPQGTACQGLWVAGPSLLPAGLETPTEADEASNGPCSQEGLITVHMHSHPRILPAQGSSPCQAVLGRRRPLTSPNHPATGLEKGRCDCQGAEISPEAPWDQLFLLPNPSFLVTLTSGLSELRHLAVSEARGSWGQREQHPQTGALGTCQQLRLAGPSTTRSLTPCLGENW